MIQRNQGLLPILLHRIFPQTRTMTEIWLPNHFLITFYVMSHAKTSKISLCNRNEWIIQLLTSDYSSKLFIQTAMIQIIPNWGGDKLPGLGEGDVLEKPEVRMTAMKWSMTEVKRAYSFTNDSFPNNLVLKIVSIDFASLWMYFLFAGCNSQAVRYELNEGSEN